MKHKLYIKELHVIVYILMFHVAAFGQASKLWSESLGRNTIESKTFVASDLVGNVYSACAHYANNGKLEWTIKSWRTDSTLRWSYNYNSGTSGDDKPAAILVDSSFRVYVIGNIGIGSSSDIGVLCLDTGGVMIWQRTYSRFGNSRDFAAAATSNRDGLVLVGYSDGTGTMDGTILKYDTLGLLQWSKHISVGTNGNDSCLAVLCDRNGDVYVAGTGEMITGDVDAVLIKFNGSGTQQWIKSYGYKSGQPERVGGMAFGSNGHIALGITSNRSSNNGDLVLLKYLRSNGNLKWNARYNGVANQNDILTGICADDDNSFFITGRSQGVSTDYDFVTIRYHQNGNVKWMQRFNGTLNGVDMPNAILVDGGDVVVAGVSMGNKNYDVVTISYNISSGNINWSNRYNSNYGEAELLTSITRDQMSNIFIGLVQQNNLTDWGGEVLCYNQPSKNILHIEECMKELVGGLQHLSSDQNFKQLLWNYILRNESDSIYLLRFQDIIAGSLEQNLDLDSELQEYFPFDFQSLGVSWAKIMDERMWLGTLHMKPICSIPYLHLWDSASFSASNFIVISTYNRISLPITGISSDLIVDSATVFSTPVIAVSFDIPVFVVKVDKLIKPIINCYSGQPLNSPQQYRCQVCIPFTSQPYTNLNLSGNAFHEIGIWLELDELEDCGVMFDVNLFDSVPSSVMSSDRYAVLVARSGFYWRKQESGSSITLVKSIMPHIIDRLGLYPGPNTWQHANSLTLCENDNLFHDVYESSGGQRYWLDFGGIYEIHRPGVIGLPKMYFYFSPFEYFNFVGGPDMNLNYFGSPSGNICSNGKLEYIPQPAIKSSVFATTTDASFNTTGSKDLFASPDLVSLTNYWFDNVIAVGMHSGTGSNLAGNYVEFNASVTPQSCTPSSLPDIGPLVSSLGCMDASTVNGGDRYETCEEFDNGITYFPGQQLIVHVQAVFNNGETINQCQYITLNSNLIFYDQVAVMIRGDIADFNPNIISYKIDVYEKI